jgi:hypothetical protein
MACKLLHTNFKLDHKEKAHISFGWEGDKAPTEPLIYN